jgi:tol-pal system protein YbgF
MNGFKITAAAGCSLLLLCQCASQDDVRRLNYQLRTVNQQVKSVESKTAKKIKEVESQALDQLLKDTANSVNRLETVADEARQLRSVNQENLERFNQYKAETEDKIASLYAAIEQTQAENSQLAKSNEELVRSLELKIDELSSGLETRSQHKVQEAAEKARAAERRAKEAAERAAAARRKADLALQEAETGGTGSFAVQTPPEPVPEPAPATVLHPDSKKVRKESGGETVVPVVHYQEPKDDEPVVIPGSSSSAARPDDKLMEQGMSRFKAKEYQSAYKVFEQFLGGQPDKREAAKAQYLMGECLFNQGEYDLAILDYQKVISNYADDPHISAALLRQGMAFEKLTDKETAKVVYAKLLADHPRSREAKVARERLENLNN